MQGRLLFAMGIASLACGCLDQPEFIIDTTGARFDWRCNKDDCAFGLLPETPAPLPCGDDELEPGYSYIWGRFIEIVSVCGGDFGWASFYGNGRLVACDEDQDCPQLDFFDPPSSYECRAGVCQNVDLSQFPSDAISESDAVALCLAEIPRGEANLAQVQALLADHCGEFAEGCALPLPESCWQP
jgi:hypothetical protein